jgi:hypothetical protein
MFMIWGLGKGQQRAAKERADILRLLRGLQATVERQQPPKPAIRLSVAGSTPTP